ncbi:MAG: carbonic anhydrase [Patulibacter minatonensis]
MIDDLIVHNGEWAEDFGYAGLPTAPARKLAVVVCMDSRIDVFAALGLDIGEAHVIRNAGGIVTDDVVRSLVISQRFLDTEEIVVIQHTRCGMQTFSDDELADALDEETGQRPTWKIGSFKDLDQSVKSSVRTIRHSPFIPNRDKVWGFVYDVESGKLRRIIGPEDADQPLRSGAGS